MCVGVCADVCSIWSLKVKDTSLCYLLQNGDVCDQGTFNASYCTGVCNDIPVCQFVSYEKQHYVDYLHAFNIFGIFWGVFFVSAVGQMVLAGTFATWYWTFDKSDVPFFTVTHSIGRTFRWVLMLVVWFIVSVFTYCKVFLVLSGWALSHRLLRTATEEIFCISQRVSVSCSSMSYSWCSGY
jgi:hypothetical protein